jgi:sugar phosphate isomerase/epimerase
MNRRDFVRNSLLSATVIGLSPALLSSCSSIDPLHEFGIITGVVREMIKEDPRGTLIKLSEMGYKYLEFGGTFGMEVKELKALLNELDMVSLAGGASITNFEGDGLKKAIDAQLEMEKKYLVCYWPWIGNEDNITKDYMKIVVEKLNMMGEVCNQNGLRFAYHNHDHEFRSMDDQKIYDFILNNTQADLVTMELDLYWCVVGGSDPKEYIKNYPGRYELLHVKDAYDIKDRESFACIGSGVIDFEPIFQLREIGGFKHLIVERDRGEMPEEECARSSIEYLNTLKF